MEQAVDASPIVGMLNNLEVMLGTRFERTGELSDLTRVVEVAESAVAATPTDHPNPAGRLNNLGNQLGTRFERTGEIEDFEHTLLSFKNRWNCLSPSAICATTDS